MRAKKSLGQNFLNSKTVARDIVRAAELLPGETILEIGPGKGFLTGELLSTGARVIAVEKDDRMIPLLEEKFVNEIADGRFTIIHGDILELEVGPPTRPPTISGWRSYLQPGGEYKIVANIPYYITGQIIRLFLETERKPDCMILMLQKEVADRIVACDKKPLDSARGKESILSIAVKAYGVPRIVKKVPARYFTPAPKVDSAVLAIEHISGKHFKNRTEEEHFFEVVKAGFAHKRKQIAGNLKELFGSKTEGTLAQVGIAPNARAEDIALEQWLALSRAHGGPTSKMRNTISNKMLPIESKNSRRDEEKNAKNIEIF